MYSSCFQVQHCKVMLQNKPVLDKQLSRSLCFTECGLMSILSASLHMLITSQFLSLHLAMAKPRAGLVNIKPYNHISSELESWVLKKYRLLVKPTALCVTIT